MISEDIVKIKNGTAIMDGELCFPPIICNQTDDKARNRKNCAEERKRSGKFCLPHQPQMQIAVTYVWVSAIICIFASLPCKVFQHLAALHHSSPRGIKRRRPPRHWVDVG